MYIAHRYGGWKAQAELWSYIEEGLLMIRLQTEHEFLRMRALMEQYRDIPMDLGNASLVAAAEAMNQKQIFTLDRDFLIYRLPKNQPFEVVPGP